VIPATEALALYIYPRRRTADPPLPHPWTLVSLTTTREKRRVHRARDLNSWTCRPGEEREGDYGEAAVLRPGRGEEGPVDAGGGPHARLLHPGPRTGQLARRANQHRCVRAWLPFFCLVPQLYDSFSDSWDPCLQG
jgi:hypothetical protein